MKVREAKQVARAWVAEEVQATPGLHAVLFGGSIAGADEEAPFGPYSDVDLYFVVEDESLSRCTQRKILHDGVLLEPSYHALSAFRDAPAVLGDFRYASHLATPCIIHDVDGRLSDLQKTVARDYRKLVWVRRRCDRILLDATENLLPELERESPSMDRALCFIMVTNNIQQIPLVALLKPPTTRKALTLFRDICRSHGADELHRSFLDLLGSAAMTGADVEGFLRECAEAFDYALTVRRTPFFADWDLCRESRHLMIDGARDIVERGYHREAVLWILLAWNVAATAIHNDAPAGAAAAATGRYQRFLRALDFASPEGYSRKAAQAKRVLAGSMELARTLIDGNREIGREG